MPKILAIDCEMVGSKNKSLLARVSVVDKDGRTIYDVYVKPTAVVTDYRTFGIKKSDIQNGKEKSVVQKEVAKLIKGCILVGHSLYHDIAALGLCHPDERRKDLAKYEPFLKKNGGKPVALKTLAKEYLGRTIQESVHDSVEDAKACMDLYLKCTVSW